LATQLVYAVRHLPYDVHAPNGWAAPLTPAGLAGAEPLADRLVKLVQGATTVSVFYSGAERTKQTGAPTAVKLGVKFQQAPWLANSSKTVEALTELREWPKSGAVILFSHAPFIDGLLTLAGVDVSLVSLPHGGIFPFTFETENMVTISYQPLPVS
jgi:phosphohistidine phosphatase SixA